MAYVVDRKILKKEHEPFWISYLRQRISKNKNALLLVTGQTGSGKSYASLRIGEQLDKEFSIDRVIFTGKALMELVTSNTLKKGSVIVFEEVGVALHNRAWQSAINRAISHLFQTFRNQNLVLILNLPFSDFLDAQVRKLVHAELSTAGIDYQQQTCKLRARLVQYNSRLQKYYFKRLKVLTAEGKVPISFWNVSKPTEPLRKAYEDKKKAYTDELNMKILNELTALEDKQEGKKKPNPLTRVQQDTLDMLKQGMTLDQIAEERKRANRTVFASVEQMRKKGYKIEPVYKKGITGGHISHYDIVEPNQK